LTKYRGAANTIAQNVNQNQVKYSGAVSPIAGRIIRPATYSPNEPISTMLRVANIKTFIQFLHHGRMSSGGKNVPE
jgi:hypothetical protein